VVAVKALLVPSFAKLNLGLEVLGTRDDGYHELRTLFQTIALHDDVEIAAARSGIRVACSHPDVPSDETNLAHRAAAELQRRSGRKGGVRIRITKRIPVAGGLGGGSSNAAAVLVALDRIWGLGLGRNGLHPIARRLGADVPYFLTGGTALGVARGDEVYPLREQIRAHAVLVDPGRPLRTADVFRRASAELTPRGNSLTISRFVSSDLSEAVRFGILKNELENAALGEAPDLAESTRRMRVILRNEGAVLAQMSGSGSAFFGLFLEPASARTARASLQAAGFRALLTTTLSLEQFRARTERALRGARTEGARETR
jgi:4-diphosphocytidyl-2-C-methyl-D-erythritol kinase